MNVDLQKLIEGLPEGTKTEVRNTFTYHKPFGNQPEKYEELRSQARTLALSIMALCPASRERSLALTNLQQAIQWGNASIAINEKEPT